MSVDVEFVKSIALQAARMALDSSRSFRAELKPDASWVTNVDREVERFLKTEIQNRYPDHAFFGEESGFEGARDATYIWLIDPIDGTTNFVHRIPAWCVSIGLLERGDPALGVIAVPPLDELYWSTRGGGAFFNGEPLRVGDVASLQAEDTIGISSDALKTLDLSRLTGRIRNLGSAALDLAYIARGSLRASVYLGEKAHDMAAGLCLCMEAGCEARWLSDGRPLRLTDLLPGSKSEDCYLVAQPNALALLRLSLIPSS